MAAKRPTQRLPFQCPAPLCGKGFHNLSQIQKHVAMSAWCGLFMQKVLDTQLQSFQKQPTASLPSTCDTNTHEPYTNLTTQYTDVDVTDLHSKDDLIDVMDDEALLASNNNEKPVGQKQTVDCHTHEQYFACKLLKFSTMWMLPTICFSPSWIGLTMLPLQGTRFNQSRQHTRHISKVFNHGWIYLHWHIPSKYQLGCQIHQTNQTKSSMSPHSILHHKCAQCCLTRIYSLILTI